MFRLLMMILLSLSLCACTALVYTPKDTAQLQQGKRDFDSGYYQSAMRRLLPLACDGNADAQYAVGYMYYYGFGVGQDTFVGSFWINRSAKQHYPPAVRAAGIIDNDK